MKRGHKRGFTIIELMIVIVVIGVLSGVISVMYIGAQAQAQDVKVQDAAQKAIDAIKLFVAQKGHFPAGGDGSSAAIGAATECADGSGGFFATLNSCTVFDTLVASGYLPSGFMDGLPDNPIYNYTTTPDASIMLYNIPDNSQAVLFIYQKAPTAKATDRFNNIQTACNVDSWIMSTASQAGMSDAYCIQY